MRPALLPNIAGFAAIFIWSTVIAFSRSVMEYQGVLNTAFFSLLFGGLLVFLFNTVKNRRFEFYKYKKVSLTYFSRVGLFFITYMVVFHVAVGTAGSREDVMIVSMINYLWPGLIFVFAVPVLKLRVKYFLLTGGALFGFAGTLSSFFFTHSFKLSETVTIFKNNPLPFILALLAAVSWALYSNLTRKYHTEEGFIPLSLFLLCSSLVILIIIILGGGYPVLKLSGYHTFEFAYLVAFPTASAYFFWDTAMKRGNKNLIVSFSFLVPLLSLLVSSIYLDVNLNLGFWLAALTVVLGSVLCKTSIVSK